MAKEQDMQDLHRLVNRSKKLQAEKVTQQMLDHGKLCPGCMEPFDNKLKIAHFGEYFCSPCVRAFVHGETQS